MKARYLMMVGLTLTLTAVTSASAADDAKGIVGKDGGQEHAQGTARSITIEEFKDRCANPDKYRGDVQRAPQNIKIQCSDVVHEYVADQSGSLPLPGSRSVVTALFSDKFNVEADTKVYAMEARGGSCLRYKEVERKLAVEKSLSCAEILGLKDGIENFCAVNLESLRSANPKLIEIKDTGSIVDTCGGVRGGKDPSK